MKKASKSSTGRRRSATRRAPAMRAEYDFRGGVRGKHAGRFAGTSLVLLDADIAAEFPNERAVNRALRAYLKARPK
jgi:hypothetical protein